MKITVMQVNNELASTGVSVYVDGQLLGSIGPGGSVSASLEAPSCLVRVECGGLQPGAHFVAGQRPASLLGPKSARDDCQPCKKIRGPTHATCKRHRLHCKALRQPRAPLSCEDLRQG